MTRILVIEDDADVAMALRTLLTRAGYEVLAATDGRAGLRRLFADDPDLMVLDVGLPGLDGWQVLERTRDLTDLPVLLLTARGAESDRVRGLRAGADDYLPKPFGNDELLARRERRFAVQDRAYCPAFAFFNFPGERDRYVVHR
ncbi:response regulator transcription factor, partial [Streptomyces noursei]